MDYFYFCDIVICFCYLNCVIVYSDVQSIKCIVYVYSQYCLEKSFFMVQNLDIGVMVVDQDDVGILVIIYVRGGQGCVFEYGDVSR